MSEKNKTFETIDADGINVQITDFRSKASVKGSARELYNLLHNNGGKKRV